MKKRSMTSLAAIAVLLAAGAAMAGDAPKPQGSDREVRRVTVTTDGAGDDFAWFDEDGEGGDTFEWMGDDGGPGDHRQVVVHRFRGRMAGHGMGGAQCDDANCDGACGGHGGPGMGMGPGRGMGMGHGMGPGHGKGMGMGRGMGPGRGQGHPGMMFAMLDLSDAQKAKMREIHEKHSRAQIQARADLQIARLDMRKLMQSSNPDQAAINAQVDKMAKMRADQHKSRIATMLEARAQLTAEQRKKFDEMRANGPMMRGGMGGPGMRMMHGQQGGPGAPQAPAKPKGK